MAEPHSDALVFFGATGDLAYKKIFPSLQAMVKRGTLKEDDYYRKLEALMIDLAKIYRGLPAPGR